MKTTNNFDGVRLIAALSVMVSHQFVNSSGREPLLFGPVSIGTLAVLVFFAMSGYLVASSWAADPTAWRFAARRFLRIWPAYLVVIIACALGFECFDPRPLAGIAAWVFVAKHLSFQQWDWAFFPGLRDPRLNASLWTIPFEAGCYVAFLAVAVLARKWWPHFLAVVCGLAFAWWAHGMAVFNPSHASVDTEWMFFGAFFAFGAVLFGFPRLRSHAASAALVLLGAIAFWTGSGVIGLVIVVPTLAILAGEASWPVLREAGRFGDFSYGIYLWAWPVQQLVTTCPGPQAGYGPLFATSLVLVLVLAVASWHLIEKTALRLKPRSGSAWPQWAKLQLQ